MGVASLALDHGVLLLPSVSSAGFSLCLSTLLSVRSSETPQQRARLWLCTLLRKLYSCFCTMHWKLWCSTTCFDAYVRRLASMLPTVLGANHAAIVLQVFYADPAALSGFCFFSQERICLGLINVMFFCRRSADQRFDFQKDMF